MSKRIEDGTYISKKTGKKVNCQAEHDAVRCISEDGRTLLMTVPFFRKTGYEIYQKNPGVNGLTGK